MDADLRRVDRNDGFHPLFAEITCWDRMIIRIITGVIDTLSGGALRWVQHVEDRHAKRETEALRRLREDLVTIDAKVGKAFALMFNPGQSGDGDYPHLERLSRFSPDNRVLAAHFGTLSRRDKGRVRRHFKEALSLWDHCMSRFPATKLDLPADLMIHVTAAQRLRSFLSWKPRSKH
ncbi:hypothetical protein [Ciceribacter sp. RN22]|uniref:hypothetical protein n=1 Tax=Ciceribacter sp. RN22 TaxID=2954932 RepID=UPI00209218F8|nr:hypothetical protein [Ciceribacter sp. RN22]MCO6180924.1 hypothetical protein [Ciceribacter sp. RN22]